ncbi:M28 family metallopeptidase [Pelomonas sp. SE-A7]|uniref:M28 family metallopeptidase n=1 Tax=Pelomonas sp. SE-A7 TaxID=3054953 RepID=UPI00259C70DA|nr:M28 family metallopeptidase [Pelomonas sp. SE-A7]MDM4767954.1 M28 family metallopeptidase [Pelomonas sp. SE-A7]
MKTRLPAALFVAVLMAITGPARAADALDPAVQQLLVDVSAQRIEQRIRSLVGFGTRHTLSDTESETRGIGAARRWIQRELQACSRAAGGRLQVEMDEFIEPPGNRVPKPTTVVNVVATLPGSSAASKDRLLVISGHYDSRNGNVMDAVGEAPGANDDASGTAVVMELACAMARRSYDATLVFIAVAGEEQGLLGARHWARQARLKGLQVEAMITNDIIGSSRGDAGQHDPKQLRLFADGLDPLLRQLTAAPRANASEVELKAQEALRKEIQPLVMAGGTLDLPTHQLGRHLKQAGERYLPGFTVNLIQRRDRYLRGGDHIPFLENGYPAVRISEPFEDFAHQHQNLRSENGKVYGDLPEFVDFAYVADVARVNAAGLATLALAPAAPRNVRLDASELSNDSTLSWSPNLEPELAGYRVVWRNTDSVAWQQSRELGKDVTKVRLPVSKDNLVFGVQALSKRGHASLASFPLPLLRP